MLKFRYLLIWAVIGFLSMAILSFVVEDYLLKLEAMQVRNYTEVAADCALQTGQGIDDFFAEAVQTSTLNIINNDGTTRTGVVAGSWYNTSALKGLRIKYDNGYDTYAESDLLKWYMGKSHANVAVGLTNNLLDRQKAFNYLYNASSGSEDAAEFYKFATSKACLRSYIQLPVVSNDEITWIRVPRIALIGASCLWSSADDMGECLKNNGLSSVYNNLPSTSDGRKKMWKALKDNNYINTVKTSTAFGSYLLTPAKVGVTYIPRRLVEAIYQNNIDLLLRARQNGDLQSYSGFVDDTWAYDRNEVYNNQNNMESYNDIVNNGMIAVNKTTSTITKIEYKNIDVFNSHNNKLIEAVFGGMYYRSGSEFVNNKEHLSKASAELLKDKAPVTLMTYSGGNWTPTKATSKYEVIAKVTFSADVILSHKTAVFTNWGTKYDKSSKNINDIVIKNGVETNKISRSNKYIYTRFYDINA